MCSSFGKSFLLVFEFLEMILCTNLRLWNKKCTSIACWDLHSCNSFWCLTLLYVMYTNICCTRHSFDAWLCRMWCTHRYGVQDKLDVLHVIYICLCIFMWYVTLLSLNISLICDKLYLFFYYIYIVLLDSLSL